MPDLVWPYMDPERRDRIEALCRHWHDDPMTPVVTELLGYLDIGPPAPPVPASTQEVADAKTEVAEVRKQLHDLETDYEQRGYGHTIALLNETVASLSQQVESLSSERDQYRDALHPHRSECQRLGDAVTDLTITLEATRAELADTVRARDELYGELHPRGPRVST